MNERLIGLEVRATKALLLVLSEEEHPEIRRRIAAYLSDRGAVGHVVTIYEGDLDLEKTCLAYWRTRLEPTAPRLEDIVSGLLIAFATSLAASVMVELGRKFLPRIYDAVVPSSREEQIIRELQQTEHIRRKHAATMLNLLAAKIEAKKEEMSHIEQQLQTLSSVIAAGRTVQDVLAALGKASSCYPSELKIPARRCQRCADKRGGQFR